MSQTENYIILKPIAERFNKIAEDITDEDIKYLIQDEIKSQVGEIDFKYAVEDIINEYLYDNPEEVIDIFRKSIIKKFQ